MSVAECYLMDVQCDTRMHVLPVCEEFIGTSSADVHRQAKTKGWKINKRTWTAICPRCAKTDQAAKAIGATP